MKIMQNSIEDHDLLSLIEDLPMSAMTDTKICHFHYIGQLTPYKCSSVISNDVLLLLAGTKINESLYIFWDLREVIIYIITCS
jgi:hypothetical protein